MEPNLSHGRYTLSVMTAQAIQTLNISSFEPGPRRRHWARVLQFSKGPERIQMLDSWAADADTVSMLTSELCRLFAVPEPNLKFHARRSPYTGACERPRHSWLALIGEDELIHREANGWGHVPDNGAIRFGRISTLMTVAHEIAHHLVFHLDAPSTAPHGRIWVARFDAAALAITHHIEVGFSARVV